MAIDWGLPQIRGGGLMTDLLRERWRHATMYALQEGPLQPSAVLEVFSHAAADKRNRAVFGEHSVYRECVHRHMADLLHGGMIARRVVRASSSQTYYHLTPVAAGILSAIEPVIDYGLAVWQELVALSRETRGAAERPVTPPDLSAMPPEAVIRVRRRVAVLVFAVLLHPQWTFTVLAGLSGGPMRPTALTAYINDIIADNGDVLTTSSVSRASIFAQLGRLHSLGYTRLVDDPAGRNPRRPLGAPEHASALTARGEALLRALEPAARFGMDHDTELTRMAVALHQGKGAGPARGGSFPTLRE